MKSAGVLSWIGHDNAKLFHCSFFEKSLHIARIFKKFQSQTLEVDIYAFQWGNLGISEFSCDVHASRSMFLKSPYKLRGLAKNEDNKVKRAFGTPGVRFRTSHKIKRRTRCMPRKKDLFRINDAFCFHLISSPHTNLTCWVSSSMGIFWFLNFENRTTGSEDIALDGGGGEVRNGVRKISIRWPGHWFDTSHLLTAVISRLFIDDTGTARTRKKKKSLFLTAR